MPTTDMTAAGAVRFLPQPSLRVTAAGPPGTVLAAGRRHLGDSIARSFCHCRTTTANRHFLSSAQARLIARRGRREIPTWVSAVSVRPRVASRSSRKIWNPGEESAKEASLGRPLRARVQNCNSWLFGLGCSVLNYCHRGPEREKHGIRLRAVCSYVAKIIIILQIFYFLCIYVAYSWIE